MPTVYVNTASVGGDGTTNNTSGATAAYASLKDAIVGEAADITGLGDLEILCDGGQDSTLIAQADWSGWTTTASDRIIIKINPANAPIPLTIDRTKYHFEETGTFSAQGTASDILEIGNGTAVIYCVFSLPVFRTISSYNSGTTRGLVQNFANANVTYDSAIFDISGYTNAGSGSTTALRIVDSTTSYVYNCLFVGDQTTSSGKQNGVGVCNSIPKYNNLFIGLDEAVTNGQTNTARNNCFQDCVTEFTDATPDSGVAYNLTDNATINSSGANNLVSKTLTFVGSGDYNLSDNTTGGNADVIDAGIGPSSDAGIPTTDAYGNTRSGSAVDLLPYEYDQATTSVTIDTAPSTLYAVDTNTVTISGSSSTPTTGNTTVKLDGSTGVSGTVTAVTDNGDGSYDIDFTFARTTARQFDATGYTLYIDVDGENVESSAIPYLPPSGSDYIDVGTIDTGTQAYTDYTGGTIVTGDQWVWTNSTSLSFTDDLNYVVTGTLSATVYRIAAAGTVDVENTITFSISDDGIVSAVIKPIISNVISSVVN